MNKCGMCGKETHYKSKIFKYVELTDVDTHEVIDCICKDCENILNNQIKDYAFERSENNEVN